MLNSNFCLDVPFVFSTDFDQLAVAHARKKFFIIQKISQEWRGLEITCWAQIEAIHVDVPLIYLIDLNQSVAHTRKKCHC